MTTKSQNCSGNYDMGYAQEMRNFESYLAVSPVYFVAYGHNALSHNNLGQGDCLFSTGEFFEKTLNKKNEKSGSFEINCIDIMVSHSYD
jgi:hypothetical protein